MTLPARLTAALGEGRLGPAGEVRLVRGDEVHCAVPAAGVPDLARLLRAECGAELVFMAAADRRADRAAFEVHYLFAPVRYVPGQEVTGGSGRGSRRFEVRSRIGGSRICRRSASEVLDVHGFASRFGEFALYSHTAFS